MEFSPTDANVRATIEAAILARSSLSAAVAFRTTVGLDRLERAVTAAEAADDELAAAGHSVLEAFRAYREAAAGDHFHRGRNTSLGGAGLRPDE
jgi:hypothetical protein